ncbi:MAG: hypothetical protein K6T86_06410 [Pirellulales bacterium]|nr:hypothetical protein [Pirellulales bacterium]
MAELRAADLDAEQLHALLGKIAPPQGEPIWCWLEAPDCWVLDKWPGLAGDVVIQRAHGLPSQRALRDLLPRVTEGRVFGPSGELHWRVLPCLGGRSYRTVWLGEDWAGTGLAQLVASNELDGLTESQESYPLWGQKTPYTPEAWVDLRIPHRLYYPVHCDTPKQGRAIAHLHVQLWKDRRGEVQFLRLSSITSSVEA